MGGSCGFTLAEVLIVLGIIGLIADMTIPTLINNVRNAQLEAAFKTAYSSLSQAVSLMKTEEGQVYGLYGSYDDSGEKSFAKHLSRYYINPIFISGKNSSERLPFWKSVYKTYTGGTIDGSFFDDGSFSAANGMTFLFEAPNSRKTAISIDVNGYMNKPNKWGYDLFTFVLTQDDILIPAGTKNDNAYTVFGKDFSDLAKYCDYGSSNNHNGAGCAYRALTEKDYFKNLK